MGQAARRRAARRGGRQAHYVPLNTCHSPLRYHVLLPTPHHYLLLTTYGSPPRGRLSSAAHASSANPTSLSAADPALSPSAILEGARQSGEQIAESLAELYPRLSAAYPVLTSRVLPSPPRQSGAVAEITSGAAAEQVTPGEIAEAVGEIAEEISAQIAELDPDAQLAVVLQACGRLGAHHRDFVRSVLLASRSEG